ncbi:MAG: radical SAM protein [bacterium]
MTNQVHTDIITRAEAGELLTEDDALWLMRTDDEQAVARLFAIADARTRSITGGKGLVWGAIGVDAKPCSRGCAFCSLGHWQPGAEPYELDDEEVCARARALVQAGVDWVTLRTTQDYGLERLIEVGAKVRALLPEHVGLVANTGEMDANTATRLSDAGFTMSYHVLRLREGIDTGLDPAERLKTLAVVRDSPLELAFLVEPVGPEHTDEEIVREAFRAREFGATLTGCMARVPVPGTPAESRGTASDDRVARVIAITRLINGPDVRAICVHPPSVLSLRAGANIMVVEAGAVPREQVHTGMCHGTFDFSRVTKYFHDAGYNTDLSADLECDCKE